MFYLQGGVQNQLTSVPKSISLHQDSQNRLMLQSTMVSEFSRTHVTIKKEAVITFRNLKNE